MSAELLQRAAAKMRDLAEGAVTGDELRGDRWFADRQLAGTRFEVIVSDEGTIIAEQLRECDAEHIASWHPAVALAVADWLEGQARFWVNGTGLQDHLALAVARAYLGEDA